MLLLSAKKRKFRVDSAEYALSYWRNAKSRHQVFFNHLLRVCEAEAHANISLIIIILICTLRFMSQPMGGGGGGVIRQNKKPPGLNAPHCHRILFHSL